MTSCNDNNTNRTKTQSLILQSFFKLNRINFNKKKFVKKKERKKREKIGILLGSETRLDQTLNKEVKGTWPLKKSSASPLSLPFPLLKNPE